jgi:hypothetical protein
MLGETVLVMVLLISVMATQLALSKAFPLLRRNFSLDEIVVHTLVSDRKVAHSLRAIAGGLDTNPPSYHLLLRAFRMLVGNASEIALRCFALLSVLVALSGLYVNLRQNYSSLVALTAVLAIWSHPLIVQHAFEARMYGPWLAAIAWFSYFLARAGDASLDLWSQVLLASTALLTCTMHTLGLLAFGLIVSFYLLFHPASMWSQSALALASLGPLAFIAWSPFLWKQNAAYTTTWVSPPTKPRVVSFMRAILLRRHLAAVLVGAGLSPFLPTIGGEFSALPGVSRDAVFLAGLAGLVLMPLILVIFSYTVQPLLVDRYALPTVASLAPAIASVISPMPDVWLVALCGLLFLIGVYNLRDLHRASWQQDRRSAALMQALREHTGEEPVLFEGPLELYVVCRYAPDLAKRCFALDFEPEQVGHRDAHRLSSRDQARIFTKFYPEPNLIPWEAARNLPTPYIVPTPYFVPSSATLQQGFSGFEKRYPGFTARLIAPGLYGLRATQPQPMSGSGKEVLPDGGD